MQIERKKASIPFFSRGDVGGLTYMVTNNIVNYIIIIAALKSFGWGDDIIFGRVIPGLSIGLLLGGLYYAFMAYRLSKKEGHGNVTALPSGISTPAMFVILYGVISPLHYAIGDPEIEWSAAVAACFIGGFVELLGGFIGPWVKKHLPRAALLGTVAGIGFIWMATQGVFDVFGDPVVGLPILAVALLGLFAGYLFPKKISPFLVAIVGGIVYAYCLGRTSFDFSNVGFYFPNPVNTVQSLINGFVHVAPYLTVIIPVEIYNFIETMDNVESANVAGDAYNVREAQFADGVCTMISAVFGGVIPNTVWLGHAGLKKSGAGAGYSWIGGVVLGRRHLPLVRGHHGFAGVQGVQAEALRGDCRGDGSLDRRLSGYAGGGLGRGRFHGRGRLRHLDGNAGERREGLFTERDRPARVRRRDVERRSGGEGGRDHHRHPAGLHHRVHDREEAAQRVLRGAGGRGAVAVRLHPPRGAGLLHHLPLHDRLAGDCGHPVRARLWQGQVVRRAGRL